MNANVLVASDWRGARTTENPKAITKMILQRATSSRSSTKNNSDRGLPVCAINSLRFPTQTVHSVCKRSHLSRRIAHSRAALLEPCGSAASIVRVIDNGHKASGSRPFFGGGRKCIFQKRKDPPQKKQKKKGWEGAFADQSSHWAHRGNRWYCTIHTGYALRMVSATHTRSQSSSPNGPTY